MLRMQAIEPFWLDIAEGARVQMRPIGPKAFRAARAACFLVLASDDPDSEEASDALCRELIRRGIIAWEGIGDAEGEVIATPTPETIEMFVYEPETFLPTQALYVYPYLARDAEGNGSAGSPDGIGTKATPAPIIAKKPATSKTVRAAPIVRTASTNARPKRAKPSGR